MKNKLLGILLAGVLLVSPFTSYAEDYTFENETIELSEEIQELCAYYAPMYGMSEEIVEAIIWVESRGDKYAKNGSCIGICQINTSSQMDKLKQSMNATGINDMYDYKVQVRTCCSLLYDIYWISADETEELDYTTARYNGQSKARQNSEDGIVSDYSQDVFDVAWIFEEMHGKHDY